MYVYKDRTCAGVTWFVGRKRFSTYKAAKRYATVFDEVRVCVNGLRHDYSTVDAIHHPHTIEIYGR